MTGLRSFFILVCLLLQGILLHAQIRPMVKKGQTRAVIVGVSEYQDQRIPRLRFSHEDAALFATWLASPAGGNIPVENIRVLTNTQATYGQMVSAYTWLLEQSGADDLAIIYFSGHGDMENQTMMNHGFLLAYDAPAANYMAGGFPIYYLQSIIKTLSSSKNTQVLMIADACRSGKLAGEEFSGTQATAKTLTDQFANEAKILSCQPNEYSLEGTQWGGGHGVFTYYLVDGLTGLADRNEDLQVSLLELQRFLEDFIPPATAPKSQIPLVTGNKGMIVSKVDPNTLAELKIKRSKEVANGHHKEVIEKGIPSPSSEGDSLTMALYRKFGEALNKKALLEPSGLSAYDIYKRIVDREIIAPYRMNMRLDLAAALQEESQRAINDYLAANPSELQRRWAYDQRYALYPEYLNKAGEILGQDHFLYVELKAKETYFKGLNLRLRGEQMKDPTLYLEARAMQELVLQLDTAAAYAHNELGLLARRENRFEESIHHFKRALDFSPTWVLARTNLCGSYNELKQNDEAILQCRMALKRDSSFALAHFNLGLALAYKFNFEEAVHYFKQCIIFDPDYLAGYLQLGLAQYELQHYQEAQLALETLLLKSPGNALGLINLGVIHFDLKNYPVSLNYFEQLVAIHPDNGDAWFGIALNQASQGKSQLAFSALESALKSGFSELDTIQSIPFLEKVRKMPGFNNLIVKYFPQKKD